MKGSELIAKTLLKSESCFTNGIADFQTVIITIANEADQSKKVYRIKRASGNYAIGVNHYVESYTVGTEDRHWIGQYNKAWKWYDNKNFEARLMRLAREVSKQDFEIRVGY